MVPFPQRSSLMGRRRVLPLAVLVTLGIFGASPSKQASAGKPKRRTGWCAPGLQEISPGVCYFDPGEKKNRGRLVVFFHGVIKPNTGWQHAQQKSMVRAAKQLGFAVMMPRGRLGAGPPGMRDWWTWPTSMSARKRFEAPIWQQLDKARHQVEQARKQPFGARYYVGFSNGAYYGASLAMRGAQAFDGYALFAGGSAPNWRKRLARHTRKRAPIYVGYGRKDGQAVKDAGGLVRALKSLKWPVRSSVKRRLGHSMSFSQLEAALRYFDKRRARKGRKVRPQRH